MSLNRILFFAGGAILPCLIGCQGGGNTDFDINPFRSSHERPQAVQHAKEAIPLAERYEKRGDGIMAGMSKAHSDQDKFNKAWKAYWEYQQGLGKIHEGFKDRLDYQLGDSFSGSKSLAEFKEVRMRIFDKMKGCVEMAGILKIDKTDPENAMRLRFYDEWLKRWESAWKYNEQLEREPSESAEKGEEAGDKFIEEAMNPILANTEKLSLYGKAVSRYYATQNVFDTPIWRLLESANPKEDFERREKLKAWMTVMGRMNEKIRRRASEAQKQFQIDEEVQHLGKPMSLIDTILSASNLQWERAEKLVKEKGYSDLIPKNKDHENDSGVPPRPKSSLEEKPRSE